MEHLKVRQKYSTARRIFNSFLSVSFGDETLRLILDILHIDVYRFNLIRQAREHDQLHVKTHTHTHTHKNKKVCSKIITSIQPRVCSKARGPFLESPDNLRAR